MLIVQAIFSAVIPEESIKPVGAIPHEQQMIYERDEMQMFIHFGILTFYDSERADGKEDPNKFQPENLDCEQWVKTAIKAGFKKVMLTAKHHDGFNLFPTSTTKHSVQSSSWRNGQGDVVREFVEACHKYGIKAALYVSPWDENSPDYCEGRGGDYNEFYINSIIELFGEYGEMTELWLDNYNGWLDNCTQTYDTDTIFQQVKIRQGNAIIWSSWGPDGRWIGNEEGVNQEEHWSPIDIEQMKRTPDNQSYLGHGDPNGKDWVAAEADVSIRPGWFYHANEDSQVRDANQLMDLYLTSVGRNAIMFLNIPPNPKGLFQKEDTQVLDTFEIIKNMTFSYYKIPEYSEATADSEVEGFEAANVLNDDYFTYWAPADNQPHSVIIEFNEPFDFKLIQISEFIPLGQRVKKFNLYVYTWEGTRKCIWSGTTIGHKRIIEIESVFGLGLELEITESTGIPLINNIQLYDRFYI